MLINPSFKAQHHNTEILSTLTLEEKAGSVMAVAARGTDSEVIWVWLEVGSETLVLLWTRILPLFLCRWRLE